MIKEDSNHKMFQYRDLFEHGRIKYVKTNVKNLEKYGEIYQGQRNLESERVEQIVNFQEEHFSNFGCVHFPGILTACQVGENPKIIIIDGQHRFSSMLKLSKSKIYRKIPVILEIIRVNNDEELHQEFVNINKSIPVPINILNPEQIVSSGVNRLTTMYESGFSSSQHRKRPRINVDSFKDYLIENGIVEEKKIKSGDELIQYLVQTDEEIRELGLNKLLKLLAGGNQNQEKGNKKEKELIAKWYKSSLNDYSDPKSNRKKKYMLIGMFKEDKWGFWLNILMGIDKTKL